MLTDHDEVKLLDFGLARLVDALAGEHEPAPALTASRMLLGTPRYMSPEARRAEPATARSDVYALGLLLYELGVGQLPDEKSDAPRVPEAEPQLAEIIRRCLQADPALRYESAGAVHEALARLDGNRVQTPPVSRNP